MAAGRYTGDLSSLQEHNEHSELVTTPVDYRSTHVGRGRGIMARERWTTGRGRGSIGRGRGSIRREQWSMGKAGSGPIGKECPEDKIELSVESNLSSIDNTVACSFSASFTGTPVSVEDLHAEMQNTPGPPDQEDNQGGNDEIDAPNQQEPLIDDGNIRDQIKYPWIGSCLRYCTKATFNHFKWCIAIGAVLAVLCLSLSLICLAGIIYYEVTDRNATTTLSIPTQTVMEVDLWEYNLDTLHQLKISPVDNQTKAHYKGLMEFAVTHKTLHRVTRHSSFNISLSPGAQKWLLRQWVPYSIETEADPTACMFITWTNLRNLNYNEWTNVTECSSNIKMSRDQIKQKWPPPESANLIVIHFNSWDAHAVRVNLTEHNLPSPHHHSGKFLFLGEDEIQDSVILESPILTKHSKLYINTRYLQSLNDDNQYTAECAIDTGSAIDLQIESQSNTDIWQLATIGASAVLLAAVMTALVSFVYCNRNKEYYTIVYRNRDNRQ